ncbi:MAG: response regulator [Elusimicrobia bacterium]|nr:response regulator [Elusimicrobiota bacterium]
MKKRDVLVVDDEAAVADAARKVCSAEGLVTDTAQSAAAGLALLDRNSYRLIVSDIMMAGTDGFGLLIQVSARGLLTPVVMVTGFATVQNAVRSMLSGAIDFIPKPFTADELLAVVRRGLKYETLRCEAAAKGASASAMFVPYPRLYRRLGHVSWAVPERDGSVRVGVCDPFLKTAGPVQGIDLLAAGSDVVQGSRCAAVLGSDGLTYSLLSPLSGRVLDVNAGAVPALVGKDPYEQGWLYKVLPTEPGPELEQLTICKFDIL